MVCDFQLKDCFSLSLQVLAKKSLLIDPQISWKAQVLFLPSWVVATTD